MSFSEYLFTPKVNNSINSRARFSLGAFTVLELLSNQYCSAPSMIMAPDKSLKLPNAYLRRVLFCTNIEVEYSTFASEVAQCPCQNHVIRSVNGLSTVAIRSSHQLTKELRCSCIFTWNCPRAIDPAIGNGPSKSKLKSGTWDFESVDSILVRNRSGPNLRALANSPGLGPKPKRKKSRDINARSLSTQLVKHLK